MANFFIHNGQRYDFDLSRFGLGSNDPITAYAWALEAALKASGFDVDTSGAATNSKYFIVTPTGGIDCECEYGCGVCEREVCIRIADHDARANCEADIVLGVGYVDQNLPTINTAGRGSRAIDQTVTFVRKAFQ